MLLTYLTVYVVLGFIAYCDLRSTHVYTLLFPFLFVCVAAMTFQASSVKTATTNFLFNNALMLFIILLSLFITSKITCKPAVELLGWGDVLFLVSIACFFYPLSFIFFFIVSGLFALLIHQLILRTNFFKTDLSVPLAGYQSIFFGLSIPLGQGLGIDFFELSPWN